MGNARDAVVGFDADQNRAAVGIGHAGEDSDHFAGKLLLAFLLARTAAILEGADEFEKLAALLFEKESDFVSLHVFDSKE